MLPEWLTAVSILAPFALGWFLRRRPVGGWLFVYLWEAAVRALTALTVGVAANLRELAPSSWHGENHVYLAFLVAEIPPVALAVAEALVAIRGSLPARRDWAVIRKLRWILGFELFFGSLAAVIDAALWPASLVMSAPAMAWAVIWGAYFLRSRRVRAVFGSPSGSADWTVEGPLG